jgi:hypothetical protein
MKYESFETFVILYFQIIVYSYFVIHFCFILITPIHDLDGHYFWFMIVIEKQRNMAKVYLPHHDFGNNNGNC